MALSAAAAVALGLTLVALVFAVSGQRDAARTAFRSQEAVSLGNELEKSLISIENGLGRYLATERDERFLAPVKRALAAYPAQTQKLERLVSDRPDQVALVRRIKEGIDDYATLWVMPLLVVARGGLNSARSQVGTDGGRARLDPIRRDFALLFSRARAVVRSREARAGQSSNRAIGLGIGGLALLFAVATGSTVYLRRSLVRPVLAVAEGTGRVAAGDLSTRVPSDRDDELGDLARGFNSMADSLQRGRDELERSNAELTRSNAELEQFASVTSHDLQAPLTTISMYAELLERRKDPDGASSPDLVDGIRSATQQARALIRDLLEYSRAGRGRLSLEQVPAALVVDQALEALAGTIDEAGARVRVGELPVVHADRANLCRVFQNLVGNAVKFTRRDTPNVTIEAEQEDGLWRFSVRDNGIGMDPEHARRIFEPFQRLHGEEDYPGTGIGLAVCERIIGQHGGRIWVASTPGEGSVFHFTLPARDRERADGREAAGLRAGV